RPGYDGELRPRLAAESSRADRTFPVRVDTSSSSSGTDPADSHRPEALHRGRQVLARTGTQVPVGGECRSSAAPLLPGKRSRHSAYDRPFPGQRPVFPGRLPGVLQSSAKLKRLQELWHLEPIQRETVLLPLLLRPSILVGHSSSRRSDSP